MDINSALKTIFAQSPPSSIVATVTGRISPARYQLADDAGRIIQADSSLIWSPGSRVTVQSGRIVASAGAVGTIKTYEV